MHELSLATEVINIVTREAEKNNASRISEIEIEVGDLSGVEANSFESALGLLMQGSVLEDAELKIKHTPGMGICLNCGIEFAMKTRTDTCPLCKSFPSEVSGGQEFRILSLLTG
ncbi:MAG: hydrogenase maturation nickel metallochaperone HypA [Bacteroidota bacterium]